MHLQLEQDRKTFEQKYPDALNFLNAAHLRFELHCLSINIMLTKQESKRAKELFIAAPACQEEWFLARDEIQRLKKRLGI